MTLRGAMTMVVGVGGEGRVLGFSLRFEAEGRVGMRMGERGLGCWVLGGKGGVCKMGRGSSGG